jgi:NAD(P)-dependent dehydrogenase (short-subunit alcohol dehydrogenase family)
LWANKLLVDRLAQAERGVKQIVMISSGAAVQGNRGWGGYSLSKAALNMLARLYAAELPETFFTAVAPGLIETDMQFYLTNHPERDRFASLQNLHNKWGTPEMPRPEIVAERLAKVIPQFPRYSHSGDFVDIRLTPWAELSHQI